MTDSDIPAVIAKASEEINRLCVGPGQTTLDGLAGRRWRMSIPVQTDDSDEIFSRLVVACKTLQESAAAQAEEIVVLRRALIAHRADLHNGSKRPCPTCYQSAHALGIADKVPNSCAYAETDRTALTTPLPARPA